MPPEQPPYPLNPLLHGIVKLDRRVIVRKRVSGMHQVACGIVESNSGGVM